MSTGAPDTAASAPPAAAATEAVAPAAAASQAPVPAQSAAAAAPAPAATETAVAPPAPVVTEAAPAAPAAPAPAAPPAAGGPPLWLKVAVALFLVVLVRGFFKKKKAMEKEAMETTEKKPGQIDVPEQVVRDALKTAAQASTSYLQNALNVWMTLPNTQFGGNVRAVFRAYAQTYLSREDQNPQFATNLREFMTARHIEP